MTKFVPASWQLEDLGHLAQLENSANWSDMGCFKTSTVLWLMEHKLSKIENGAALIITTPSGKGTYFEAVPEILPDYKIFNFNTRGLFYRTPVGNEVKVADEMPKAFDFPAIVLSHYHVFARTGLGRYKMDPKDKKKFLRDENRKRIPMELTVGDSALMRHWDFVGLDEAHRIKNPDTRWTSAIKKIKTEFKHAMTGTGFINNPSEVWSILHFLYPDVWPSYWRFTHEFCKTYVDDSGYEKIGGVKEEKLEEFKTIMSTIGVRRTKQEVFPNLPSPIFSKVEVELNPIQRTMYESIKDQLYALDQNGAQFDSPNVLAMLSRLRQICVATPELQDDYYDPSMDRRKQVIKLVEPSSKLDALEEVLAGLQWGDVDKQQMVVFSNFTGTLALLKIRLDKLGIPYIHMEQKDNDRTRYEKWFEQFPKKEHQVFMSTLQLGSESINLTSAEYLAFLDRSWSPKDNEQGISRCWRPGQTMPVNVINFEAINTVDQRVEKANITKTGWFKEIFGNEPTKEA